MIQLREKAQAVKLGLRCLMLSYLDQSRMVLVLGEMEVVHDD